MRLTDTVTLQVIIMGINLHFIYTSEANISGRPASKQRQQCFGSFLKKLFFSKSQATQHYINREKQIFFSAQNLSRISWPPLLIETSRRNEDGRSRNPNSPRKRVLRWTVRESEFTEEKSLGALCSHLYCELHSL